MVFQNTLGPCNATFGPGKSIFIQKLTLAEYFGILSTIFDSCTSGICIGQGLGAFVKRF